MSRIENKSNSIYKVAQVMMKAAAYIAVAVVSVFSVSAASWRLYPAFDRSPVRIMDTENETFFLVHQQVYDKNMSTGYEFPTLALFHYSKDNPTEGIQPLSSRVLLSSSDIRLADYNPVTESLFVIYGNGGIDIVSKERSVKYLDILTKSSFPGMGVVNSVSFDPVSGDSWIATDAGYLQIDASGEAKKIAPLGMKLVRVFGIGENIVGLSGNRLYVGSADARRKEDLSIMDSLGNVAAIFPINGSSFYYLSGIMGGNNGIFEAVIENGEVKGSKLGEDRFTAVPSQSNVTNRLESNIIPVKDGYLLFSSTKVWHLMVGDGRRVYSLALGETSPSVLGSWDMKDFWYYKDRGQFVNRHADYTSSSASSYSPIWSDNGEAIRPNAPASVLCPDMTYSPRYGLLIQQHGYDWTYRFYSRVNPAMISGLKGNEWKVYSQAYDIPYAVESDASLLSRYYSDRNLFPMADTQGIAIDPLNPDYVWAGSLWSGIGRFDLSDIRRMALRFGSPLDKFADLSCFHVVCEDQKWDTLSCFAPPAFDEEGTLWTLFFDYNGVRAKDKGAVLYYLTASERAKIAESESTADVEWGKIALPVSESINMISRVMVLNHPSNRNKLVVFPSMYNGYFLIYDHKGTLQDSSDDECVKITTFNRPEGTSFALSTFNHMTENPSTGEVFVATDSRAFSFNPGDKVENNSINVRLIGLKGGSASDILPESTPVNRLMFDPEGRLWIGTTNQGVIGVDKDFSRVIARYNTDNSPIPSNMAYGLGWNSEDRSILISTDRGLASVQPDVEGGFYGETIPSIYPQAITPGYNGVLWIRNLSPDMRIVVADKDGNVVRNLISGTYDEISWDLKDDKGERLRPGSYELRISDGSVLSLPILTAE